MSPNSQPSQNPAELIKSSFSALEPKAPALIDRFYERLFQTAPSVRKLFPKDMAAQKRHLLAAVALVVKDSHRLDVLTKPLQEMGRRHVGYGAQPEHYPVVRDTMLATLQEFAGPLWTPPLAKAWTDALNRVASIMIEGAGMSATSKAA